MSKEGGAASAASNPRGGSFMSVVDQVARDSALVAIMRIDAHERVCVERANEAKTWRSSVSQILTDLGDAVEGLYSRIWIAACSIIVVLLGMCGYLINHRGL